LQEEKRESVVTGFFGGENRQAFFREEKKRKASTREAENIDGEESEKEKKEKTDKVSTSGREKKVRAYPRREKGGGLQREEAIDPKKK